MNSLTLIVDLPAGITIFTACEDAIILATKLDTQIKFDFNDKTVYALPNNNVNSLVLAYKEAVKEDRDFVCTLDKAF